MSWFDEQLKVRRESDDENFSNALDSVASAVMGTRLSNALSERETAGSAIEEVLKYFHFRMKKDELPASIKTIEEQIDYRTQPFGVMRRNVELQKGWYKDAVGPMLGTLQEDGSAVALIPGHFAGYTCIDFKSGKRIRMNRKTENMIDKGAVCFYQPLPLKSLKVRDLLAFMVECLSLSDLVLYVGMMLIAALFGLIAPRFTQWLFRDVIESKSLQVLFAIAGFMITYTISNLLIGTFQALVNARVGTKQNIAVQAAVMNRIMSLPASFFKDYAAGELTQRSSYVQGLCSILMNSVGTVGLTSVFSLIYIAQIFNFAPALVVPSICITLATVIFGMVTAILQTRISKAQMEAGAKTSGLTYATIRGIQKIKLAGAEKRMFARWAKDYSKEAALQYNPPVLLKIGATISLAISMVGTLILYYLAVKSQVGVANYYAFNASYGVVSGAFSALAGIAMTIATIRPILDMAKTIMEAEPEISEGRLTVNELRGAIEVSNLSFRYDDEMPNVIDDLSLKIRPGEYLAIAGTTGCGKSTLMRLLLGFEKPQKGAIYYDRHDISKVDVRSLRRKIGTVMQDGKLFLGDIFSNIIIAAPDLKLQDAWEAAEIASIADDIRRMPMGMNTIISEGQGGISGGQKQRLMIARAVAPKPKILMFDEATSALDNVTQRKVTEAIDKLNCTRIVIAHRLSTIRHADRIIFLDQGRIAEEGSYDELIAKNGLFAELVERQRLDVDVD